MNTPAAVPRRAVRPLLTLAALLAVFLTPLAPARAAVPGVTKVLVFVEENHSLAQMRAGMPYTFALAQTYGYATRYTAITHPSLPNYIAMVSGQTYGITDDGSPKAHVLRGPTVFGQAIAAGKTAKTYAEGMTTNCQQVKAGLYRVKHNPWSYFLDERALCATNDAATGTSASGGLLAADITAGTLPNVGMVVPDLCNDAHDCPLSIADNWFEGFMERIFAGPDWASGRLAVVLTADEASGSNTVLTVVIHPSQNHRVVTTPLTHYSLARFYADVAGVPYLANAATAPSMSAAFGF
jgi:phosphatidylinositol-3-phosphatase